MISFADDIDLQHVCQEFSWSDEWKFRARVEWRVEKLSFKINCHQFNKSSINIVNRTT